MKTGLSGLNVQDIGIGARLSSYHAGRVLATDIPAKDVLIEWTREREVPTRLSFTVPVEWIPTDAYSPLANFGQRILLTALVESDGTQIEVEMGQFIITSWEEGGTRVSVEAFDLLHTLAENPMPFPSSPPTGATLFSEINRLCDSLPVVLDCADRAVSRDIQFGFDRVGAISDLCRAMGVEYAVKADGCLHVFEANAQTPVWVFAPENTLIDSFRSSTPRRANRVLVVGADNTGAHAFAEMDSPPFHHSHYGWVTNRVENDAISTSPEAKRAALELAKDTGRTTRKRTVQVLTDPRIEGGDIVGVDSPDETFVGKVVAYAMNLSDASATMRIDIEVEEW